MLKVKIKNFQSVAETSFDIDGFTVIVGKNNKGKSAIVRSIDAALSNRLGNNFIKWGKLETQVNLKKDALDLTWVKNDTASYKISNEEFKDKPYTSLKGAVPGPILEAGFRKLEIADEKLNPLIAHQFEELFLINRSGPFVTETLSTLYDLNTINDADSICQKRLRASRNLLKTRQADTESLAEKLNKFKGIDELKTKFEGINVLQIKVNELKNQISEMDYLYNQLSGIVLGINKLKVIKEVKIPDIKEVNYKIKDFDWLCETLLNYNQLTNVLNNLNKVKGAKPPDIGGYEKKVLEYGWLNSIISQYLNLTNYTKNLSKIKEVKIPEVQKVNSDLTEYTWISKATSNYQERFAVVKKLEGLKDLKAPDLSKTRALIEEIKSIFSMTDELKTTLISCERCKNILSDLKGLNFITVRLKGLSEQIKDFTQINTLVNDFIPMVQTVKEMQAQHKQAVTDLEAAKVEMGEFKMCPLCKKPMEQECSHA